MKLQEENNRLHDEYRKMKDELECMKKKIVSQQPLPPPPLPSIQNIIIKERVDLTYEDISDDDIEIVSTFTSPSSNVGHPDNTKKITDDGGIIEINDDDDDDDDVQVIENVANNEETINEVIVETTPPQIANNNDGENQQHHSIQPLDVAPENNPLDVATKPNEEEIEQAVNEIQKYLNTNIADDDEEPEVKKARMSTTGSTHENDFKFLQDFILSQI